MYQRQFAIIQNKEQDVNQYIDYHCQQIDSKSSGKTKTNIIKENLVKAQQCVDKINLFMQMQSKDKIFIFNESFLSPWNEFYKVINKIFKNTSFLNIVSNPIYIQFQMYFYENKDNLRFSNHIEFLTIQDIKPCIDQYQQFYVFVNNIFTKIKDVSVYKDQIQKCAQDLTKNLESKLPKNSAKEYLNVKQQWLIIYEKIFKYKLQTALSNGGKLPSILQFIQTPDILMQAVEQAEKQEQSKEAAMQKQIQFLTSMINDQYDNNQIDDEIKELKECIQDFQQ